MGWHIRAYYDIDQDDFGNFVNDRKLDHEHWKDEDKIAMLYRQECLLLDDSVYLIYYWNDNCKLHELYETYGVNFIRDDDRFCNERYHMELVKKVGRPFPECLRNICWNLHIREDALNIANELSMFFPDDDDLKYFAQWLMRTAKYCSTYDISY